MAAYIEWLDALVAERNVAREAKVAEERAVLRALPVRPRENPHPSRRPQHRLHRPPPRTAAPCAASPTPGLPISGPVLTAPAGAPQPRYASPPVPFGLHRLPDTCSCLPARNRVISTAICLLSHRHRTPQRPDRYSRNHGNRRVILPILRCDRIVWPAQNHNSNTFPCLTISLIRQSLQQSPLRSLAATERRSRLRRLAQLKLVYWQPVSLPLRYRHMRTTPLAFVWFPRPCAMPSRH